MTDRLLVIGGGLGGLTAALTLRQAGFAVEVHEQAPVLGEVGAGLTLSRGAQNVFRRLGLQDQVAAVATPSTAFPFVHYRTGELLTGKRDLSLGLPDDGTADIARQCHRADLHAILASAVGDVRLDHRLTAIEDTASGVRAIFANGDSAVGNALIAADGVRSVVRPLLVGEEPPRFTCQVAYRFLLERGDAAPYLEHGRGAVFIGPRRTFNRYTLRGGAVLNCVGIAETAEWIDEGWSTPATQAEVLIAFAGWHPSVLGLIERADRIVKWGIFDRAPLSRWRRGRVTLLGDAAHAMLPFLGMGAAMAIEDAMILARALTQEREIAAGFERYEAARCPRTALLHAKSVEQGKLTQALNCENYRPADTPAADPYIFAYDPTTAAI